MPLAFTGEPRHCGYSLRMRRIWSGGFADIARMEANIAAQRRRQALFALNRQAGAMEGGRCAWLSLRNPRLCFYCGSCVPSIAATAQDQPVAFFQRIAAKDARYQYPDAVRHAGFQRRVETRPQAASPQQDAAIAQFLPEQWFAVPSTAMPLKEKSPVWEPTRPAVAGGRQRSAHCVESAPAGHPQQRRQCAISASVQEWRR